MSTDKVKTVSVNSKYRGTLTREQFLFYEMRITARLLNEGKSEEEAIQEIVKGNLFQYPTERELKKMACVCIERLKVLNDEALITAIATQPSNVGKQICLYAMMKYNRLVWDFMITVIGEKYRLNDFTYSRMDLNVFFMRLQEQDDNVAAWTETTISKIKQVLNRVLIENEYLDSTRADHLNPVLISSVLENAIRGNNDIAALPAFNCFM